MAELLTDDIIIEKLEQDGFMEEPDGPWILEYITEEYGGKLDTTSDYCSDNYTLKIYSESTYDCYDIFWCTHDERPYVSQDGCLLYTSPSPRDGLLSRMPSSA